MKRIFIYGAYGYTGKLIVDVAVNQGLKPILGGRNAQKLNLLAKEYALESVAFDVTSKEEWDKLLPDVDLVLNCAGPFAFDSYVVH